MPSSAGRTAGSQAQHSHPVRTGAALLGGPEAEISVSGFNPPTRLVFLEMPLQTIKSQNPPPLKSGKKAPEQLLLYSCTSRTHRLLENRGCRKRKPMPNTARRKSDCLSPRPPPQLWHYGLGSRAPSCCRRSVYFALHKGKPGLF